MAPLPLAKSRATGACSPGRSRSGSHCDPGFLGSQAASLILCVRPRAGETDPLRSPLVARAAAFTRGATALGSVRLAPFLKRGEQTGSRIRADKPPVSSEAGDRESCRLSGGHGQSRSCRQGGSCRFLCCFLARALALRALVDHAPLVHRAGDVRRSLTLGARILRQVMPALPRAMHSVPFLDGCHCARPPVGSRRSPNASIPRYPPHGAADIPRTSLLSRWQRDSRHFRPCGSTACGFGLSYSEEVESS